MSDTSEYVPKVGDEVEVVLRGRVHQTYADRLFRMGSDYEIEPADADVVSVTRVRKPLPTETWTVVKVADEHFILTLEFGWWHVHGHYSVDRSWLADQDWRIVSVPVQDGEAK